MLRVQKIVEERFGVALFLALVSTALTAAQTVGEIGGAVTDTQGLAVPGVTVTLEGEALIAPQTVVTLLDGSYRFRALGRGSYDLSFEIPGFRTLVREGVIVEGSRAVRIDAALELATVAETITVSGDAPVVDLKTTALVNDFGVEELQDVPSATDVWAVLGQTPGVRMRGFDVGGSHKSQQTGYESFGIRDQNRVLADGVDTTEGEGGTGFYFDYYSIGEFTTTAAGADVQMTAPGSLVMMTMKSGGNDWRGMFHGDYEHESFVGENIDDALASRGYTGNPNLLFFETHADLGGPIVRDRAWFYGFYNHFRIDKAVSGVDRAVATDLGDFDQFGGKVTVQAGRRDRFIGYTNWGLKQKPKRGLSTDVGPDSVLAQDSWSWAHKAEWQRVWSDRTFTATALKHFGFGWPMVPQVDPAQFPPRLDTATGRLSGAGWFPGVNGSPPFTFRRWKPQVTVTANHYTPAFGGSHDIKAGYEFQIDSSRFGSNANSGHVRYLDDSANARPFHVDRITLFSMPAAGEISSDDRNRHHALFLQDTWRPTDRLALNLGMRYEQQHTYFLEVDGRSLLRRRVSVGDHRRPDERGLEYLGAAHRRDVRLRAADGAEGALRALLREPGRCARGRQPRRHRLGALRLPRSERQRDLRRSGRARRGPGPAGGGRRALGRRDAGGSRPGAGVRRRVGHVVRARAGCRHVRPCLLRPQGAQRRQRPVERRAADGAARRARHLVRGRSGLGLSAERADRRPRCGSSGCPTTWRRGRHPDRRIPRHGRRLRHLPACGEPAFLGRLPAAGEPRLPVARRVPCRCRRVAQPALRRSAGGRRGRARPHLAEPQPRRRLPAADHQLGRQVAGAGAAALRRGPVRQRPVSERLALRIHPAGGHPRASAPTSRFS